MDYKNMDSLDNLLGGLILLGVIIIFIGLNYLVIVLNFLPLNIIWLGCCIWGLADTLFKMKNN